MKRVWIGHANSRDSGGVLIPLLTPRDAVKAMHTTLEMLKYSVA